jgi:hypothetical protein
MLQGLIAPGFEEAPIFEKMESRARNQTVFPQKFANALYAWCKNTVANTALVEIGVETSEQLDIIPQQVQAIRHERVKMLWMPPCLRARKLDR